MDKTTMTGRNKSTSFLEICQRSRVENRVGMQGGIDACWKKIAEDIGESNFDIET